MYKSIKHLVFAFLCLCAMSLHAQNQKISIQSTLKDISGKAIPDGPQNVTFRLYNAASGGTALWTEIASVEVVGGIYSHKLGSITPLNPSDFGVNLFLGVTVSGGQELTPRTELTYSPYAMAVGSLAGNGKSASFETNGNFKVTGSGSFNGNVSGSTINGVSIVRGADYSQFGGRINVWDNGRTDIHASNNQNVVLHYNGGVKFYTDASGAITQGRHLIGGNVEISGGSLYTNGGSVFLGQSGDLDASWGPSGIPNVTRWLRLGDSDTGLRSSNDGNIEVMSNSQPAITVKPVAGGGNVGINESNPQLALVVNKTSGLMSSGNWDAFHFNSGGSIIQGNAGGLPFNPAAFFHGGVIVDEWLASAASPTFSDIRTKKIIGISNSASDLNIINQIKITDYTMIDSKKDNGKYKKVIAQDIFKIFPQATSQMRKVVPDLYCFATNSKQEGDLVYVTLDKKHQLVKGDKIDLYHKDGFSAELNIEGIVDESTFYVKSDKKLEKIFIYGKYVNDFLSVDYDAISMLNVSATQELYKKIVALENENKALKSATASLEDRMAKIEAMLTSNSSSTTTTSDTSGQK